MAGVGTLGVRVDRVELPAAVRTAPLPSRLEESGKARAALEPEAREGADGEPDIIGDKGRHRLF